MPTIGVDVSSLFMPTIGVDVFTMFGVNGLVMCVHVVCMLLMVAVLNASTCAPVLIIANMLIQIDCMRVLHIDCHLLWLRAHANTFGCVLFLLTSDQAWQAFTNESIWDHRLLSN